MLEWLMSNWTQVLVKVLEHLLISTTSLIIGIFSIWVGLLIGENIAKKSKINLSWLAGIILIILACLRLF